ncbi:MAG: sigma-70 family RNA polymerase sigma factor [Chloroflexota bacterium]
MTANHEAPSSDAPRDVALFESEALPHLDALYRTARRLTSNDQAAEDLVQDALERAYTHYDRFQPGTNMRAWLFRILSNLAISGYRRRATAPSVESLDDGEEFSLYNQLQASDGDGSDVEARVLDLLGEESIRAAIEALPMDFRMVVLLADVEGFAYKEIAEILGIPRGTVMSRLFRGRRLLQRSLWEQAQAAGISRVKEG